jgi:hypothetical protein
MNRAPTTRAGLFAAISASPASRQRAVNRSSQRRLYRRRVPVRQPAAGKETDIGRCRQHLEHAPRSLSGSEYQSGKRKTDFMALIVADRERPRQCIKQSDRLEKTRHQLTRA